MQDLIDTTNDVHYEHFRVKYLAGFSLEDSMKRYVRIGVCLQLGRRQA